MAEKENAIKEKTQIEVKKLRASQVLSGQALELVGKVGRLDASIEMATARGDKEDVLNDLAKQRDDLLNKRDVIDEQIREGRVLGDNDERKLTELEEAVEMLEAAIDFKSDQISTYQEKVEALEEFSEPNLLNKVYQMERPGLITLLTTYFKKVVDLKETEKSLTLQENELLVKVDEQERVIQSLQHAVHQSKSDFDRRTADIIKEYENKTQLLLKQIQATASKQANSEEPTAKMATDPVMEVKMKDLERELFYYKTTSRDLKKKLRELAASGLTSANDPKASNGSLASARSQLSNGNKMNFASDEVVNSRPNTGSHQTPRSSQGQQLLRDDQKDSPRNRTPYSVQSNVTRPEKVHSARDTNAASKLSGSTANAAPFTGRNSQNCVSVVKSRKELREIAVPESISKSTFRNEATSQPHTPADSMQKDSVDE